MKRIIISCLILLFVKLEISAQQFDWEEKVFVHLSKNIAITGEPIWFSIDVESTDTTFVPSMAYIEIVNRNGLSVHQLLIPLENGKGSNNFKAPLHLISDHYLFRCYTRSSAFTGEKGVFNQLITIINPEKPAPIVTNSKKKDTIVIKDQTKSDLISENTLSKNSSTIIKIPESGILSISISNPFLDGKYDGRIAKNIYKPLQIDNMLPEPYGHVVHARVRSGSSNQPYYLSAHGRQNYFNIAKPNEEGEMFFELASFKEVNFLLAQKYDQSSAMDFELISPFLNLQFLDGFELPVLELKREQESFLENLILAGRVEEYYYKPETIGNGLINTEIKPDKTYILDDYNRFENVEITLKEYIPEVYVRKSNRNVLFKVMNDPTGIVFQENPLLLIDNMPIMDANAFAAFDPKGIEKIDLINRKFYFNDQAYDGVISLTSKNGDFGGFELPKEALYLDYYKFASKIKLRDRGVNPYREDKNFPDFRNLIYWNDEAEGGVDNIYPSELSGTYVIRHSFYDGNEWSTSIDKVEVRN